MSPINLWLRLMMTLLLCLAGLSGEGAGGDDSSRTPTAEGSSKTGCLQATPPESQKRKAAASAGDTRYVLLPLHYSLLEENCPLILYISPFCYVDQGQQNMGARPPWLKVPVPPRRFIPRP